MNKSTFFGSIKDKFSFLPIGAGSLRIDLGGDATVLLSHVDARKNEKVKRIGKELFPSVFNGQIENSENFLKELSFAYEMVALTKARIPVIFESKLLYIITRQETPAWQRELIKNGSYQLLFDNCIFSSHEEIFSDLIIRKFGESSKGFGFVRFYNNEIFINTTFEKCYKADVYPSLFVFALKEFLENKYHVVIKSEKIPELLEQHYAHNPKTVGKKNIKYELAASRLNGENIFIEPGFNEISDALRPITKATLCMLQSMSNSPNQNMFYFYSDVVWVKMFLKSGFGHIDKGLKIEFVDIEADEQNFFLDYKREKV